MASASSFINTIRDFATVISLLAATINVIDYSLRLRAYIFVKFRQLYEAAIPILEPYFVSGFLLHHELLVILSAGILFNFLGLSISRGLNSSLLYLDMWGTSITAILLGPWWGAIVGLITNSFTNLILFTPGVDFRSIFPWLIVNLTGGFYWGFAARHILFRRYLSQKKPKLNTHIIFLIVFGIFGVVVLSLPAYIINSIVDPKQQLNYGFIELIGHLNIPLYFQMYLRFLPDKIITVILGLITVRYAFPLFEKELIHGSEQLEPPRDTLISPLLLGLLYIPAFIYLCFEYKQEWWLWILPFVIIVTGAILSIFIGSSPALDIQAKLQRSQRYDEFLEEIKEEPFEVFFKGLDHLILFLAIVFTVSSLPIQFQQKILYRFPFTLFSVIYGVFLFRYILHHCIHQNYSRLKISQSNKRKVIVNNHNSNS